MANARDKRNANIRELVEYIFDPDPNPKNNPLNHPQFAIQNLTHDEVIANLSPERRALLGEQNFGEVCNIMQIMTVHRISIEAALYILSKKVPH